MFSFTAKRRETALDIKIAAANSAIESAKQNARDRLAAAEIKLAESIARRDSAPAEFYRAYNAIVRTQSYLCDQLRNLSA